MREFLKGRAVWGAVVVGLAIAVANIDPVIALLDRLEQRLRLEGVRETRAQVCELLQHGVGQHGLAVQAIRAARPGAELGITNNHTLVEPASEAEGDLAAAGARNKGQDRGRFTYCTVYNWGRFSTV